MTRSVTRLLVGAMGAGTAALALTAAAPSGTTKDVGSARAFAVRIVVPGGDGGGTEEVRAPPDTVSLGGEFSYPADGSVLTTGSATASASSSAAAGVVRAQASAEVVSLSLFGGEVTAERVAAHARVAASRKAASGDTAGSAVTGLTVLGQPAGTGRVALGDWGYADTSPGSAHAVAARGARAFRASAAALTIRLTADHGTLPVGTQILVGFAESSARASTAAPSPRPAPKSEPAPRAGRPEAPPEPKKTRTPRARIPRNVKARLTPEGYVFPVFGPSSWTDTFGAPRADTGWHHGADIFAPLGAPVLAVNDGTVFSVGFIPIGGNRLWLRDEQGNQFYYAHLSAFSPLAVNRRHVEAGDVLGFVGATGDARGTPYHLHFEIHPRSLLRLGYDGVVNPTRYLAAWQHLQDVDFPAARGSWARGNGPAPAPGAILLQASDISQASGLDPRSLERALAHPARDEGGASVLTRG